MSLQSSFRFYELPDMQRTIDIIVGLAVGFSVQYAWKKRTTMINYYNLTLWYLSIITSMFFYETSKMAKLTHCKKIEDPTRMLSIAFLIYGSSKVGKTTEMFVSMMLTALASKKTPEESRRVVITSIGMFLFANHCQKIESCNKTENF